ncbi:MAG: hybrid sensor histidine kinase/response regulator [Gemmatimonadetes bacterium]|nr:hybrid sensor histidine kinase/response regulator [Gemmatimonadota bacterium]
MLKSGNPGSPFTGAPELDFRAIFAAAPTAYLLVRADPPQWTILAVSDEYCRITRQRREHLIGRGTFEAFPESHGTESSHGKHNVRSSFEVALSMKGRIVLPIQRYDLPPTTGIIAAYEEHYWRMSSAPVYGADAGSIAVLHAVENVTDQIFATRKEQEALAAARTAEDRLRTVFAQAPVGVAVLRGREHRFESTNQRYVDIVGRGDLIGHTVREAFPDLEGQGIFPALDRAYATGETFVANEMFIRLDRYHDGGLYDGYFDFVYQPLREPSGAVEGIAVVITDVSTLVLGRKEAEARERATAELNETLVAQQSELEALNTQLQEQATELEQQTEEAQLLSEDLEIANETLRQKAMEAEDSRVRAEEARREAEESERLFRTTANSAPVLIWTSGLDQEADWFNQPWLDFTGRALKEEQGSGWTEGIHPEDVARCLATYRGAFDAHAEFSIEYRLRKADGEYRWILDNGVPRFDPSGNFTGYIGSCFDVTDLRIAREAAENANRTKADFLAAMSHELRTPLNAISGYAQLMEMELHGPITDQQRTALERIRRSHTVLARLIEDVLSFARIDAGHVDYNVADVPVDELLSGVEAFVAPQLAIKGLEYAYARTDPDVTFRADRDKVEQIMLNLLSNAIKFTDAGRIAVECEATQRDVLVRVRDTGRGIPVDKLQSIFEPFVQVDSGLKRGTGGTGLGLAISRELARGMSGDITAHSADGEGAIFTLTLPRI